MLSRIEVKMPDIRFLSQDFKEQKWLQISPINDV